VTPEAITAAELLERLEEVFDRIEQSGAVFEVVAGPEGGGFVLGPVAVFGWVLGLYDVEYGWPVSVDLEDVREVVDIAWARRRHPFISRRGRDVAVAVSPGEYVDLGARCRDRAPWPSEGPGGSKV